MANALYDKAREAFLNADIDWSADDIRVILVDSADYAFSSSHEFLSSVGGSARVATSGALQNKTATNGAADADDITLTSVTGDQAEALIIYKHTGSDSTARLIAYIDTGYTGLPVTPNGGNVTINWPSGSDKIFKI